jgi:hypothetical protein
METARRFPSSGERHDHLPDLCRRREHGCISLWSIFVADKKVKRKLLPLRAAPIVEAPIKHCSLLKGAARTEFFLNRHGYEYHPGDHVMVRFERGSVAQAFAFHGGQTRMNDPATPIHKILPKGK